MIGAVEIRDGKYPRRCRLQRIVNIDRESLHGFIRENTEAEIIEELRRSRLTSHHSPDRRVFQQYPPTPAIAECCESSKLFSTPQTGQLET
ncbi:hypothetical protein ACDY96_21600 [Rhizobium mongolense]|uniref:hypothetical protein n=1 Tax=Rhizobium mongolense TaxID=57676 RepID=UPI0035574BEC